MPILFLCLECGTEAEVADDLAGKVIKCRECHTPGKVPAPPKRPEPAAAPTSRPGHAPVSYRCPFCGCESRWVWDWYWTPASTIALILLLPSSLAATAFAVGMMMATAAAVKPPEILTVLGLGAVGFAVCVYLGVTVGRPLLCEARQVCPECRTRLS
jgi:hypothetical protein